MDGSWHTVAVDVDDDGETKINGLMQCDTDLRLRLKKAVASVRSYHTSQDVIEAVLENRNEIVSSILNLGAGYLSKDMPVERLLSESTKQISRQLANTCSMFRSMLDHSDYFLKHRFGEKAQERIDWTTRTSAEYDNNINYALMYLIRNYIQHKDMPPLSLSLTDSQNEEGITLRVELLLSELLSDSNISKKILHRIDENTDRIPVLELLEKWSQSLTKLAAYVKGLRRVDAICSAKIILELRESLAVSGSQKLAQAMFPHSRLDSSRLNLRLEWLHEDDAAEIMRDAAEDTQ